VNAETKKRITIEVLQYISRTPELLSLLYDLNLLPEQIKRGSIEWHNMLLIANWCRGVERKWNKE